MNSLEFIKENIEYLERQIAYFKKRLNRDFNGTLDPFDLYAGYTEDELKNKLENLKSTSKHLQQIKIILEAWEIVKQDFIVAWENPDIAIGYYLKYFGDIEYETIKKALEVKEDE